MKPSEIRIEPGVRPFISRIYLNDLDISQYVTAAVVTQKPGEIPNVKLKIMSEQKLPDTLIIKLIEERNRNGHRKE